LYTPHPTFVAPKDENAKVWRYISVESLLSILNQKALFFVRASELDDPYEGTIPNFNQRQAPEAYKPYFPSEERLKKSRESIAEAYKAFKQIILINSWYLKDFEVMSMWRSQDSGVLIESTYRNLRDSFKGNMKDPIYIGSVKYLDFDNDWMPEENLFEAFITKRRLFESEMEIRALRMLPASLVGFVPSPGQPPVKEETVDPNEILDKGKYVSMDPTELINRIVVAPKAGRWVPPLLSEVLATYDVDKPVVRSTLYG
jgi:hypothetical protein